MLLLGCIKVLLPQGFQGILRTDDWLPKLGSVVVSYQTTQKIAIITISIAQKPTNFPSYPPSQLDY